MISTDDSAHRLEYVYLGPTGVPFPFQARITPLVAGIVMAPVFMVVAWLLMFPFDWLPFASGTSRFIYRGLAAALLGPGVAVLIIRAVGSRVDPVRPLAHHFATLLSEIRTPRVTARRRPEGLMLDPAVWLDEEPRNRRVTVTHPPAFLLELTNQ